MLIDDRRVTLVKPQARSSRQRGRRRMEMPSSSLREQAVTLQHRHFLPLLFGSFLGAPLKSGSASGQGVMNVPGYKCTSGRRGNFIGPQEGPAVGQVEEGDVMCACTEGSL